MDKQESSHKNCIDCKHWYFSAGSSNYSEYTPGFDASISCQKDHWEYESCKDTEETFRKKMHTAETCKDYEYEA